ncbi:MAG TPA: hypothetical protein VMU48_04630 [Terracidiphilus sp.]|nr:hypothetical protein [Terracidiphilus sp.]
MILPLLQIAGIALVALYLGRWRAGVRRRNTQTWESLLVRLRPDWSARELSDHFLWKEGLNASPEDAWTRMEGPHGLWVMYQNAKVMLEMADFAARNCSSVDLELLATLRSDAMQIRVCVLMALTQYAFSQASEGVRVNAFRAASMYTGMAARMTQLLQANAAVIVPDFVAAM